MCVCERERERERVTTAQVHAHVYHSSCNVLNILDSELAFLEFPVSEYISPVSPAVDEQTLLHFEALELRPTMLTLRREDIQDLQTHTHTHTHTQNNSVFTHVHVATFALDRENVC